jgi:hypothetical protein
MSGTGSTPPAKPSISQADLEKLRKRSDKVFQHYNFKAAQKVLRDVSISPTFLQTFDKHGHSLAKEITNRLNDQTKPDSKLITCHARTLLNKHALAYPDGLDGVPIEESEPYYFFVRFKITGSNSIYFNLDFYLPQRNNNATKTPKIIKEIVHFSIHSNPARPLYKRLGTTFTEEVNEKGKWPDGKGSAVDYNGMIHAYESKYIDGSALSDRPLRRFLLLLHRANPMNTRDERLLGDADYRKEIVLVSQRSRTGNLNLHPLSTSFMTICMEVLQEYFDSKYAIASFIKLYDGPKTPYTTIPARTLPAKPSDVGAMITKDNANGLKWGKFNQYHTNLASEMTARLKRTEVALKMQALDYFVKKNYGGKYEYDIKLTKGYPLTTCLKDISILTVNSEVIDGGKTVKFDLAIHFRFDSEKSYDNLSLSSIAFKNFGMLSVAKAKATYEGYMFLKNIEPKNTAVRYYTLDGTTIKPLYQSGDLTSISVGFGEIATQVMSDFIASGYDPTSLQTSYYDCSGVGSDNPVPPPADQAKNLPRLGGRRTLSNRKKQRATRKKYTRS